MDIAIYTLTSSLHDAESVKASTEKFLGGIGVEYVFRDDDYSDYGSHDLNIIYVRTGGTEGIFLKKLPQLTSHTVDAPFYLLTSGQSNSLAASLEILSYLRQQGMRGEVIHGSNSYIAERLLMLEKVEKARRQLRSCHLGVIGEPSDWLISSHVDATVVKERLGVSIESIGIEELLAVMEGIPESMPSETSAVENIRKALPGANRIYLALRQLAHSHQLNGFTIRCFDLLSAVHNTGCLALAKLSSEGIVSGCEGDVPALLSMVIGKALTGITGFQANPARVDIATGELLFAHCTIPFNLVERYELDTHFESGIGVGIRGFMKEGPVTVFKVSADLARHYAEEGYLVENLRNPNMCRTQQLIRLCNPQCAKYFLTNPIGNHHIILPGHHKKLLDELMF